jgi:hypothetical protein
LRDLQTSEAREDWRALEAQRLVTESHDHMKRKEQMKFKNVTPIFVLPLVPVVALTLALSTGSASVSASSERDRPLHVTKECSEYTGAAGSFCTITSSSLERITIGSRVYYDQPAGIPAGMLDSNVVLDAGNGNRAVGRCTLDATTGLGLCTFSDGMGRFAGFNARVQVTPPSGPGDDWHWEGTYSFNPND